MADNPELVSERVVDSPKSQELSWLDLQLNRARERGGRDFLYGVVGTADAIPGSVNRLLNLVVEPIAQLAGSDFRLPTESNFSRCIPGNTAEDLRAAQLSQIPSEFVVTPLGLGKTAQVVGREVVERAAARQSVVEAKRLRWAISSRPQYYTFPQAISGGTAVSVFRQSPFSSNAVERLLGVFVNNAAQNGLRLEKVRLAPPKDHATAAGYLKELLSGKSIKWSDYFTITENKLALSSKTIQFMRERLANFTGYNTL